VKTIEGQFILHKQNNQQAAGNTQAQTEDIDQGMGFTSPKRAQGDFQIISDHTRFFNDDFATT
jgi:hypothetical protein